MIQNHKMDADTTRLVHIHSGLITPCSVTKMPKYIAISHTWADNLFSPGVDLKSTSGFKAVRAVIADPQYATIEYCWIDTLCIDQNRIEDKKRQIPLMGQIYHNAEVVAILVADQLEVSQLQINDMAGSIKGLVEMAERGTWIEHGETWSSDDQNRARIKAAMDVLEVFTRPAWGMRVWTMQEFILAQRTVWVDGQAKLLKVPERLFQALPEACNMLAIEECLVGKYMRLFHHFQGMAGAHLGLIEPTRVMELLGNKKATVPEDEIIGLMAASGVVLDSHELGIVGKEKVWAAWWQKAVNAGHLRWALLPPCISIGTKNGRGEKNCVMPSCSMRHLASANSGIDVVEPLGPFEVSAGAVTMTGRIAGQCSHYKSLGRICIDNDDAVHRDVTLILFSKNNWSLALRIASAFGMGRYTAKFRAVIAQVLVFNYHRAQLALLQGKLEGFRPRFRNMFQIRIWTDFMTLQTSHMPVMNEGIAFLAKLSNAVSVCDIVIVTSGEIPSGLLIAIDFGAVNDSEKTLMTIVKPPPGLTLEQLSIQSIAPGSPALHRVGVSMFLQVTDSLVDAVEHRSYILDPMTKLEQFRIGGRDCHICSDETAAIPSSAAFYSGSSNVSRSEDQLKAMKKHARFELTKQNAAMKLRWKKSQSRAKMSISRLKSTKGKKSG